MSHFTRPQNVRRVPPYAPPLATTQAQLFEPEGHTAAKNARERILPLRRPDHSTGPPPIMMEGEPLDLVETEDPHHPGMGGTRRRVLDLMRGREVAYRIVTYPDGPECRCRRWTAEEGCAHIDTLRREGAFPEEAAAADSDVWTLAAATAGGEP